MFGVVVTSDIPTQHARYVYEEQQFSQVQAAIMAYHAKQAKHPAADVETVFEWTVDPETGAAKVCHTYECAFPAGSKGISGTTCYRGVLLRFC